MKKSLGKIIFIIGVSIAAILAVLTIIGNFVDAAMYVTRLIQIIGFIAVIPFVVFAIIAIVKDLNRKKAIIGLIIGVLSVYFVPWIINLIFHFIGFVK